MSKILSLDISGNFHEGKGTTGYAIALNQSITEVGKIEATNYKKVEDYWLQHTLFIRRTNPNLVVVEGYRLYHHKGMKAQAQANSLLETPQLLGIITLFCYQSKIPLVVQYAKDVKTRWKDEILNNKGIVTKKGASYYFNDKRIVSHEKDAIRHMMHFIRYGKVENK